MSSTDAALERLLHEALDRHDLRAHVAEAAIPTLAAFTALLVQHGQRTNLVGTTAPRRLVDEVIADALQAAALLPRAGGTLVDVGSGAGIPAIPLAIARPEWRITSVEPREKRVLFQQRARRTLGLSNLQVFEGRLSEEGTLPTGCADRFDVAVTKAVWAPAAWIPRGRHLVGAEGTVLGYANDALGEDAVAWDEASRPIREARRYTLEDGRARQVLAIA